MLDEKTIDLIHKLRDTDDPFSVTDDEFDQIVNGVKKARGDEEKQIRRGIRLNIARNEQWKFADDGGFMKHANKEWQDRGCGMFGAVYSRYERLAIYLHRTQGMDLDKIEELATSPV